MPDLAMSREHLALARRLVFDSPSRTGPAEQAKFRRAVSSAYYSVFHGMARAFADSLVGDDKNQRSNRAWIEVYRALQHGEAYNACRQIGNAPFPDEIRDFAVNFLALQVARHSADYDPLVRLNKEAARFVVLQAGECLRLLNRTGQKDLQAFAAWVLFKGRGVADARARARAGKTREFPAGPVTA